MMRLLIADDHTLFRDAIATFIQRAEPHADILTAKDFFEVLGILAEHKNIDLIMLDLRMPGMEGLEGFRTLHQTYPSIPLVLMSGVAEREHVKAAMSMGAVGYFPKTLTGKSLLKAIHLVLAGEIFMPLEQKTHNVMPSYYGDMPAIQKNGTGNEILSEGNGDSLTPRELTVLQELVTGAANKDIARSLNLQVVTVKLHIRGICRKLSAKNRTHAALIAIEKGLIQERVNTAQNGH